MSKRYEKVPLQLTPKQLAKLNSAPSGAPVSIILSGKGKPVDVYVSKAMANKLLNGSKRVKFSAPAIKAMRGAGILTDTAKLASNVVQGVVDQFDPSGDNKLANTASDILLEAADVIERGFEGKKPINYQQLADQHNRAVERAKKYTAADIKDRKKVYEQTKKIAKGPIKRIIPGNFDKYDSSMAEMAKLPRQTAKSAKAERFKLMRGDKKAKQAGAEIAAQLTDAAKSKAGEFITGNVVKKVSSKVPIVGDLLTGAVESIGSKTTSKTRGEGRRPVTGRHMKRNMYGLGVSGDTLGEQAANFIREALKKS